MAIDYEDHFDQRRLEDQLNRLGLPEGPAREKKRRELEDRRLANQAAREEHRAALAAQQAAERRRREAERDAQLEPIKRRLKRQWLADHLESDERVFEQKVWPQLKLNVLEDEHKELLRRTQEELKATGMYSM